MTWPSLLLFAGLCDREWLPSRIRFKELEEEGLEGSSGGGRRFALEVVNVSRVGLFRQLFRDPRIN
jgi:hypothetical protein